MELIELKTEKEIFKALEECKNDFFAGNMHNDTVLRVLAEKLCRNATVLITCESEQIVGLIAFYHNNQASKTAYISTIVIKNNQRNQGFGRFLLQCSIEKSTSAGMDTIKLEVDYQNYSALAFYKKQGFAITKSASEKSIYMEKRLI